MRIGRWPLRVPWWRALTNTNRRPRGQALVEFAIVLPVFLLVVGTAIDLGRLFQAYVSVENAAKEGVFYAATNPRCDVAKSGCTDPNTVDWHVRSEAGSIAIDNPVMNCLNGGVTGSTKSVDACVEGDGYKVSVTHHFALLTPLLQPIFGSQLTLTSTATASVFNKAFDPNATPFPMPSTSPSPTASPTTSPSGGCGIDPVANFTYSVNNKRVAFDGSVSQTGGSGCSIASYSWQFGDGNSDSGVTTSHNYASKNTPYDVTLTVTNQFGSNSLTQTVTTE